MYSVSHDGDSTEIVRKLNLQAFEWTRSPWTEGLPDDKPAMICFKLFLRFVTVNGGAPTPLLNRFA